MNGIITGIIVAIGGVIGIFWFILHLNYIVGKVTAMKLMKSSDGKMPIEMQNALESILKTHGRKSKKNKKDDKEDIAYL